MIILNTIITIILIAREKSKDTIKEYNKSKWKNKIKQNKKQRNKETVRRYTIFKCSKWGVWICIDYHILYSAA